MKTKRKFRWLTALLAVMLLCLSACSIGGTSNDTDTDNDDSDEYTEKLETATEELKKVLISDSNGTEWQIVYPSDCDATVKKAATKLQSQILTVTRKQITCTTDATSKKKDYEILVGEVARSERMQAIKGLDLGDDDYIIKIIGTKVVILGGSDSATVYAVSYFMEHALIFDKDKKSVSMLEDFQHTYIADGASLISVDEASDSQIIFSIRPDSPTQVACKLVYAGNHGWRLLTSELGTSTFNEVGASQYLSQLLNEEPVQTVEKINCSTDANGNVTASAPDGSQAVLQLDPFSITFYTPEGVEIQKINTITVAATGSSVSGELTASEAVIGTGERFNGCNQRGKKLEIYSLDEWNVIDGNGYFSIPLFLTSRGAGIFVNLNEYMTADLGSEDSSTWTIRVQEHTMDMYIFTSGDIKDAIYGYDVLSGFAGMPEDWSYGMIVCRYGNELGTTEGVKAMVEKMEENNLQWSAVILEGWGIYNTSTWAELKELCTYIHSLGKKALCYIRMGAVYGNLEVPNSNYLVKLQSNGSSALPAVSKNNLNPDTSSGTKSYKYIDVTNPDAVEWFFNDIWKSLINDVGIDGAKVDFCEIFPDNQTLTFKNGETSGSHHWYPTYFTNLLYKMFASKPDGGMVFARGGGIGSQRNTLTWAGDQKREFSKLKAQLSGVLSSGLSGIPFMSFDMSGYRWATDEADKAKEKEVFIRGTEWSAFTTCLETNGLVTRPYDFDTETIDIYRTYTDLHEDLIPYIRELAKIATETGLPVVRHLALGWQDDSKVYTIDDEFMMGDGLLVAPILSDTTTRTVYLPEGKWKDLATGEVYTVGKAGKTITVTASLSSIPVYLNMNHTSRVLDGLVDTISAVLKSMQ